MRFLVQQPRPVGSDLWARRLRLVVAGCCGRWYQGHIKAPRLVCFVVSLLCPGASSFRPCGVPIPIGPRADWDARSATW